ncbi:MAG: hypothetical protein IKR48_10505 [Kiritimatiellae bacterium]|nr:hypothetical protein [Kiritimatiellia bacterium]
MKRMVFVCTLLLGCAVAYFFYLIRDSRERKRIEVTLGEMRRIPLNTPSDFSHARDAWGRELKIKVCGKRIEIRSQGGDVASTNDDIVLMLKKTDECSGVLELSYPTATGRNREFLEYE